jgi:DNA repair protein RadD
MTVQLRDYQKQAATALHNGYAKGLHRLGIQQPTGTGKTVVMADISGKVLNSARTSSVNILLHRDTLIDQTIRKLLDAGIDPDDIGVVKGRRHEINKRCRVISIHSLRDPKRMETVPKPQLTVVDEAHVSVSSIYRRHYEWIGAVPGGSAYLAGFTATWMRSDKLGLGDIWEEVVFKRSIGWAVDRGYLVKPYSLQLGGDLDMSQVRTAADGDYSEKDLGEQVMVDSLRDTVVNAYHTITPGKSIALFAPTQASARFFAEALKESGVSVAEVFSSTKPKDRKWAFHGFETGAVKVLVTCSALAEGWDSPRCDGVFCLRRTKFAGRFIQEIGRALRPWVGKELAWILDFVGTLDEKDMAAAVDLSKTPEPGEDVDQELEECDECGEYRVLRYVSRIDQNLCQECFKLLDIEPEERELTAKKITGVHHVDLFERTSARWLETDFGMPFIATSEKSKCGRARIFFMVPINGMYNVGVTGSTKTFAGGYWLAEGVTPMEAARIGSDAALDDDPTITHKKAAWRQTGRTATPGQQSFAQTLNISVDGMTMAQASDAITIKIASRTLGPVYRSVYQEARTEVSV